MGLNHYFLTFDIWNVVALVDKVRLTSFSFKLYKSRLDFLFKGLSREEKAGNEGMLAVEVNGLNLSSFCKTSKPPTMLLNGGNVNEPFC